MENLRPLGYIRERPFPELNLTIDRQPVRIADTQSFDEDVDPATVSLATAIATTLWLWHPNALRAFLDFEKFSKVEWNRRNVVESAYNTCVINRSDRIVLVSSSSGDISPESTANASIRLVSIIAIYRGLASVRLKSNGQEPGLPSEPSSTTSP